MYKVQRGMKFVKDKSDLLVNVRKKKVGSLFPYSIYGAQQIWPMHISWLDIFVRVYSSREAFGLGDAQDSLGVEVRSVMGQRRDQKISYKDQLILEGDLWELWKEADIAM